MAMTMAKRKALDMTLENVPEEMNVTDVVLYHRSKEILTEIDEKSINAKGTNEERFREFVEIIKKRGERAYLVFKEYLEKCGLQELARELEKNANAAELESEKGKQIERWNTFDEKFTFLRCKQERICHYEGIPGEINILLIGKTGSGKSATGNTIIGKPYFRTSGASGSVTRTIDVENTKEDRFNITVIDTPGLFNTTKHFENDVLMAEIMEKTLRFKQGIHLFLLLINSLRITHEDEETIDLLKNGLGEDVFSQYVVVVIPNALAKFGGKAKRSLRDDITEVKEHGGKFATLLELVESRIIAVENCFDDNFSKEIQRQKLLCYLAEVIHDNKGSICSFIERTNSKVRHQKFRRRKKFIVVIKELYKMREPLNHYFEEGFLPDLSVGQMDNLLQISRNKVNRTMAKSGVGKIPNITKEDVLSYMEYLIEENQQLIAEKKLEQRKKESDKGKRHMDNETKTERVQSYKVLPDVPISEKEDNEQLDNKISPRSEKKDSIEPDTMANAVEKIVPRYNTEDISSQINQNSQNRLKKRSKGLSEYHLKMAMTTLQRNTLTKTLEVLTEDLNVIPAIIHFKSQGILTENDRENIIAKVTEKEKVMEFIKIIKKRGTKAYSIFIEYLKNCPGSEHLAEELDNNLKELETEATKQIDRWKGFEDKFHYFKCTHESISSYQGIPQKINVLLIGKIGSGKSATGNTIVGNSCFKAASSSQSVTGTIDMKVIEEKGINITVIDTPGLFDIAKFNENEIVQNEDLMLEIAKTMTSFNTGIHLFLVVCSSTVRFTKEDQETIKVIEKILGKDIYSNCVVILTNARAQFGGNKMEPLKDYVKREIKTGGKFAELLAQVKGNIIAVENCFDDDFLEERQREKFLGCLAQVIEANKGSVYSNKLFEAAHKRVEQQEQERKMRVTRADELITMKSLLRKFLITKYLNTLSEQQLDSICQVLSEDIEHIMDQSGVFALESITKDEVQEYVSCFIQENRILISKLKEMKLQESNQRKELEKMEAIKYMQLLILSFVGNYLRQQSQEELEILMKNKEVPEDVIDLLADGLATSQYNVTTEDIQGYVMKFFWETSSGIQRYLDDKILERELENKLKQLETTAAIQVAMIKLREELPDALELYKDDELRQLISELKSMDISCESNWKSLVRELLRDSVPFDESCFEQSSNSLQSISEAILDKRVKTNEAKEKQKQEHLRNAAFSQISIVIKGNLKSFLTSKAVSDLENLEVQMKQGKVPEEIITQISNNLSTEQKELLGEDAIEREVIKQLMEQSQLIVECMESAKKCFAGSTKVSIKWRGNAKISNVKVGDEILVYDENGHLFYDKVYLLSHAIEDESITFIRLKTSSGKELFISPGHLLPAGSLCRNVSATDISMGDIIFTLQNSEMTSDIVTSITYELCRGAYCPMTMHGTIVVNDVAASCYTTFFPARLAHVLLSPIRFLFGYLPLHLFNGLFPYDAEEGMPILLLRCRNMITTWRSL